MTEPHDTGKKADPCGEPLGDQSAIRENALMAEMAADLAHEISQPLTVLISNMEMLRMRCQQLDEKSMRFLDRMNRSAQTLNDLIKRVQALYQNQPRMEFPYTNSEGLEIHLATVIQDEEVFNVVQDFLNDHRHQFHFHRWTPDMLMRETEPDETPDILLVDYSCCFMHMEHLLRRWRNKGLNFPVVCLADAGSDRALSVAMTMGVMDYLPKAMLTRPALGRLICYALDRYALQSVVREAAP